jgi:hypothetical protein
VPNNGVPRSSSTRGLRESLFVAMDSLKDPAWEDVNIFLSWLLDAAHVDDGLLLLRLLLCIPCLVALLTVCKRKRLRL